MFNEKYNPDSLLFELALFSKEDIFPYANQRKKKTKRDWELVHKLASALRGFGKQHFSPSINHTFFKIIFGLYSVISFLFFSPCRTPSELIQAVGRLISLYKKKNCVFPEEVPRGRAQT